MSVAPRGWASGARVLVAVAWLGSAACAGGAKAPREAPVAPGQGEAAAPAVAAREVPEAAPMVTQPPEAVPRDPGEPAGSLGLAFAREPRDEPWSTDFEQRLRRELDAIADTEVAVLECRTTVCKLVARYQTHRAMHMWGSGLFSALNRILASDGATGYATSSHPSQGAMTNTMFITRPGFGEPRPDGSPSPLPAAGAGP